MNRPQAISADRAKTEIAPAERRFEVFRGAAGLTAIREDWNRVTRALNKPRFFHLYDRVINDGGVSVSINMGFHAGERRRRRSAHLVNLEMRRPGLRPAPFNMRPAVDSVKRRMSLAIRAKNKIFRSLRPEVTV